MKRNRNIFIYQVRKVEKACDTIANNKLLDTCINGNGDLFAEIKKMRNSVPLVANSMDGVKVGISDHFKNIYSKLYNSVDDQMNRRLMFIISMM